MIAITGATGKLGTHVIENLVKKVSPSQVIAFARTPAKAQHLAALGVQIRQADYTKKESLVEALKGVEKLLIISSNEIGQRESQHKNIIQAAQVNHVKHIAYTSILRADSTPLGLGLEHRATESEIKKSGIAYTFLRNGWYLENHTENMNSALEHGVWVGSAGEGRFSSASRLDYAQAAVTVLAHAGHENKIYELGGSQSFTLSDLAKEISQQTKKAVSYKDLPEAEYEKLLTGFGLPPALAHMLADSDTGAKQGGLFTESKDLEKLIERKTTTLAEAVTQALKK